jgi:hypothetical protein
VDLSDPDAQTASSSARADGLRACQATSDDVYAGMAIVQFADRTHRFGLSADFQTLHAIRSIDQLVDLAWLDEA